MVNLFKTYEVIEKTHTVRIVVSPGKGERE